MTNILLDFEHSLGEIEERMLNVKHMCDKDNSSTNLDKEMESLQIKYQKELKRLYSKLDPWQKVQIARHQERPHFSNVERRLLGNFIPLAGDRVYGEDKALIGGLAKFNGRSVLVLGQEKGSDTKDRIFRNFGMARPEGYRKAQRLMQLAERFRLPVISFVDTSGAYPGVGAEERGQAEAIAKCIEISLSLTVPTICVVLGEGGSGGAIAIATSDRVLMLEHSIYSVISPEGCASILWRDSSRAQQASEALKLTAEDLKEMHIIDEIIAEPVGGAHRDHQRALENIRRAIRWHLDDLCQTSDKDRIRVRKEKYLAMGRNL